jgi:hypothetical protein
MFRFHNRNASNQSIDQRPHLYLLMCIRAPGFTSVVPFSSFKDDGSALLPGNDYCTCGADQPPGCVHYLEETF